MACLLYLPTYSTLPLLQQSEVEACVARRNRNSRASLRLQITPEQGEGDSVPRRKRKPGHRPPSCRYNLLYKRS
ncbi:hypothetical protein J6590_107202, partial [Homalodisca vitripennis]